MKKLLMSVLTVLAALASFTLSAANITMTNGPAAPTNNFYVGSTRTNVILCQAQLTSDVTTYPSMGAYGRLTIRGHVKDPNKNHSVTNIRCIDSMGNIFDYPEINNFGHPLGILGGYGSNDGREFATWIRFIQYIGCCAFMPEPGAPVTITIIADLGIGWESGDVVDASIDSISYIIAEGNYNSPTGVVASSITILSDAPYITSVVKTGGTNFVLAAIGKPSSSYDIQTAISPTGAWHKLNTTPILSSVSGDIVFNYGAPSGEKKKFFRLLRR